MRYFSLLLLLSTVAAFAGSSSSIFLKGSIVQFDEKTVMLKDSRGSLWSAPKSAFGKNVALRPDQVVTIQIDRKDVKKLK